MARRRVQYGVVKASDVDVGAGAPGFRATWQSKADLREQVMKKRAVPSDAELYFWDGELWLGWDEPDDLPGPEGDPLRIKIVCPESIAPALPHCKNPESTGPSVTFATDKTGQKVTELQQPVLKQPPALHELQTFIFQPLAAKIPVTDSFYNSLVARNDSLKATIEPASLSGAGTLAALVHAALESEFDGGDEIVIAGQVDELMYRIWACMSKYDMENKLSLSRKRNRADESATLKGKRPDLCITSSRALLFKGEDKTSEKQMLKAIYELGKKMSKWKDSYHGKVEYLMCYACAGSVFQFCAVPRDSNIVKRLGQQFSLATQADRLCIIVVAIQMYQVIKAQHAQLPDHYFPLGCQQSTSFSTIEYFDGYVQKRVAYSAAWPEQRKTFMVGVYEACDASPFLIHAKEPPYNSSSKKEACYVVDLEPLGVPLHSGHSPSKPKNQAQLRHLIKCVMKGLQALHNAEYGHTDVRWENIIQCGSEYRLIDLEFACKLGQLPFTPEGHERKSRPELYVKTWTVQHDLMLVGDLLLSSGIGLDAQGEHLMKAMQAEAMTTSMALQHPWLS